MDVVITDLDGTLLDHSTYSHEDALPALTLLNTRRIPLVYCSSKTRKEIEYWRGVTANQHPFIVENGGAVVIPAGYFPIAIPGCRTREGYVIIQLGDSYAELVSCLAEAAAESGCAVRGFHNMSAAEVAASCDLSLEMAELAKAREFDEPFLVLDRAKTEDLLGAIERKGRRWTRGGRFYHIFGANDKGAAVGVLLGLYRAGGRNVRSTGLGDGVNDAAFLNAVDTPILIRTPWLHELQAAVPSGQPTTLPGPQGWNEAILGLFA